jgi:beta-phosphoglucomutase family hydrolase
MKPYKAFIFDMNGTIIDDMPYHAAAWVEILAELGHPLTIEAFNRQLSGKTNEETLLEVMGAATSAARIEAISTEKEKRYQAAFQAHMVAIAGFMPLLATLQRKNKPVAVATSADRFNIDFTLDGLGIWGELTAVVGAEDIENSKPHPEIFLKAAAMMDTSPEDCLVFEDSLMGIEAARRANMDVYAILTTLSEHEALALPHVIGAAPDFLAVNQAFFGDDEKR